MRGPGAKVLGFLKIKNVIFNSTIDSAIDISFLL